MSARGLAAAGGVLAVALGAACVFLLARDDSGPQDPGRGKHPRPSGTGSASSFGELDPSGPHGSGSPSAAKESSRPSPTSSSPSTTHGSEAHPTGKTEPSAHTETHMRVVPGKGGGPVVLVLGPDGKPVAEAVVEARTRTRELPARPSNASGEAALDPVAESEGEIFGRARHPRFAKPASFTGKLSDARIIARFEANATGVLGGFIHDVRGLAPRTAELLIVDENGVETTISSGSFSQWEGAGTGLFRVDLAPGKYTASASAKGFVASDKAYATIQVGGEAAVELVVEGGSAISGKVTLPQDLLVRRDPIVLTFDIESVRGADTDNPTTFSDSLPLEVGPDGSYRLEPVRWGKCRLRVKDATRVGNWAQLKLDEGQSADGIGLTLDSTFTSVRGQVRDYMGQPVEGAQVVSQNASVMSDAGGNFELRGLDPGKQNLSCTKSGFEKAFVPVEVPVPGKTPPEVGIMLFPCGAATGLVTRKGAPAPGVKVVVVLKVSGGGMKPFGPVFTDQKGSWTVPNLDRGNYFLKLGESADPFDDTNAPTFDVNANATTTAPTAEVP